MISPIRTDVAEHFLNLVRTYIDLKGGKDVGFPLLQHRSRIPATSLRRIVQGERPPSFPYAVRILRAIKADKKDRKDALKALFPDVMSDISDIFSDEILGDSLEPEQLQALYPYLTRQPDCQVVVMCATRNGFQESEIKRLFGDPGLAVIESLSEDGLVIEEAGRLRLAKPNYSIDDPEVAKMAVIAMNEGLKTKHLGTKMAALGHITDGVNEAGLSLMHSKIMDCIRQVSSIRDEPQYQGNIVVFATFMMDTVNAPMGDATNV